MQIEVELSYKISVRWMMRIKYICFIYVSRYQNKYNLRIEKTEN